MMNVGKAICIIVLLISGIYQAFSQPAGSSTLNKIEVTGLYAEKDYEGFPAGDNEYRWKLWLDNELLVNCFQRSGGPGWYNDVSHTLTSNQYVPNVTSATYELRAEAWEEDGCGGECSFNTGVTCNDDGGHCGPNDNYLILANYQPGMTNSVVMWPCTSGNPYAIRYEFSYNVPRPQRPTVTAPSGQICDVFPTVALTSNSFISSSFLSRTTFIWEYRVNFGGWNSLGQSNANVNGGRFSFAHIRFLSGLTNITANTDVYFRVKTRYSATNGTVHESVYGDVSTSIHLSPLPPTINSVTTAPSCPNQSTGTLTVNVTGFGEYLYVLRPGEDSGGCNPGTGDCGGYQSTRVFSNTFEITGVAAGRYTLFVANRGSTTGVCSSYTFVDVGALPVLQIDTPDLTSLSCHGGTDGAVELTASGGLTPWTFTLTKTGFSSANSTGVFNSLTAGSYTATVTDGCDQISSAPAILTEPRKVEATVSISNPFCNSPADGSLTVTITQGEGRYSYRLLKNSQVIRELNDVPTTTWLVNNLEAGAYTIEVKDAQRLQCEGFIMVQTLVAAPPFEIIPSNITTQNISCFEDNNGIIRLQHANESGAFEYILSQQGGGIPTSATVPEFTSLAAGNYSLTMRRNRVGCLDRFDHPEIISITQPDEVVIALNKFNISCFGLDDGKIISSVIGATPTDHYVWEKLIGTNWATLSSTNTSLQSLSSGSYRLRLNNDNGCTAESDAVVIEEPEALSIASVNVKDIICFGEQGEIEAIVQGGVTPYLYKYTTTSGTTESSSQKTLISEGLFTLEVSDVNGCATQHPDALRITSPQSALSLSSKVSDFNGYNISCAGANNGSIQMIASGGSGTYQYALNETPYQTSALFEQIGAGVQQISLKDGRGCIVTKTVTLTEPTSELEPILLEKNNVKCYGDQSGSLSVSASGGIEPYSYKLFQNLSQNNGLFQNLPPGSYTITISDKNGCTATYQNTIDILSTPMSVLIQKTDVSCFDGTNGAIETEVAGGTLPIQYLWSNNLGTASSLDNLRAGDYTLEVTDQQGCKQQQTATIQQPEQLIIGATAIPVCVGKPNGELRLSAEGGTAPYVYSSNAGSTYQEAALFTAVAAGTYTVVVKDARQCEASLQAEVSVRNDRPEPNFIVATKQNALDTLVIREISVPKPDSIEWTFDPDIKVLVNDPWSPQITVDEPGNYAISLKGFFDGCEYSHSLTLNINPFDPVRHNGLSTPSNGIKEMSVSPNPNNGTFEVVVELNTRQRLAMKVIDVLGMVRFQENWEQTLNVTKEVDLSTSTLASGIYVVQAITDTDVREVRIVINR